MVDRSKSLIRRLRVLRSTTRILKRDDPDSFYRAISADGDVQDGINPHCVVADELHRWKVGKRSTSGRSWSEVRSPAGSRWYSRSPPRACKDESPLCWRYHEYARQVRDGIFADPHFYGRIYGAPPTDDWTDIRTWVKANPSLEITEEMKVMEGMSRPETLSLVTGRKYNQFRIQRMPDPLAFRLILY